MSEQVDGGSTTSLAFGISMHGSISDDFIQGCQVTVVLERSLGEAEFRPVHAGRTRVTQKASVLLSRQWCGSGLCRLPQLLPWHAALHSMWQAWQGLEWLLPLEPSISSILGPC